LYDFSPLEERLVAPRLPFMQIRLVSCGLQSALRGNLVNVENDLEKCASVLPRTFNETSIIQVKLMRKMIYKKPYMFQTVRLFKVLKAAQYLVQQEGYIEEGISLSSDWKGYNECYR